MIAHGTRRVHWSDRLWLVLWLSLMGIVGAAGHAVASDRRGTAPTDVAVQAAFLFKFGSYVDWPPSSFPSPDAPFRIAVVGAAELAGALESMVAGRSVLGRPVSVLASEHGSPLEGFHIVFVGEDDLLDDTIRSLEGHPTLVVTRFEGALARGSMINFVIAGDKLRFDISLQATAAQGLKISSRLLAVARRVAGADAGAG